MANQQQTIEQMFGAALELPREQRGAYLEDACRGAPEIRRSVEELLAEDERAGSFLQAPLLRSAGDGAAPTNASPVPTWDLPNHPLLSGPARFEPSQIIAGRFVVIRFIARGGMGEVYEVGDQLLQDARVALKIIRPEIAADAGSSRCFEQEVLLARKVTHPNLCPIYEIFRCEQPEPAFLFLTMKLLDGETLEARLKQTKTMPREEAAAVCTELISGLQALHVAGIIHRDIKPNNVMLERSAMRTRVSIMDFGLARLHETGLTSPMTGVLAGTPGYLAPELLLGHRPTQATDIFALGVVLHQVLTGLRPPEARNGLSVAPGAGLMSADAPPSLIRAVKEFLADDPEQRCRAFEQAGQSTPALVSAVGSTRRAGLPGEGMEASRLSRRGFLAAAGATVCAAAGVAVWRRNEVYDLLHPLPRKRFVALLSWPPPADARTRPMVMGLIDAMASELARAEAFDRDFFVAAQRTTTEMTTPTQLNEVRESLGANLVLATSGIAAAKGLQVFLHVLDPADGRTLRSTEIRVPIEEQFALPERTVRAAAELLDVAHYEPDDRRSRVGTDSPEALAAFRAAEALMKEPNNAGLDAAIEKYKIAVEADRHHVVAYAHLAIAYMRLYFSHRDPSWMTLAKANAETAVSLDSKSAEAHVALGSVFRETGDLPGSLHEFGVALSLDPSDTRTMTYQAQAYQDMNRWMEAEEAFKRVLRLRPNYWVAYNQLGFNYNAQGNYVDALAAYRAASAAAPNQALPFNNIASTYFQLGSFDLALAAADRSLALAPVAETYQTRSDILRAQGKYSEALKSALSGAKLDPEDGANWLEAGDALSLLPHREKDAKDAYRRAAEAQLKQTQVNPNDGPGLMLLALYRVKSGEPESAPALMERAEAHGAADLYSQLSKVRILELLGRRDEASQLLGAVVRKGVTVYQVQAVRDLDALRSDMQFSHTS